MVFAKGEVGFGWKFERVPAPPPQSNRVAPSRCVSHDSPIISMALGDDEVKAFDRW